MYEVLRQFYENYDEDGRLLTRYGQVEYLTTMRYIQRYLRPGMRILEIGAATGRYSHALARMGYQVDAVELLEHNIALFQQNTHSGENITVTQGNAVDLSAFADEQYDITLLLGPMYHLMNQSEQLQALSEALRVTKTGGILFAAYCNNDATMLQYCFGRGMLMEPRYRALVDPVTFKARSDPQELFQLYRREDIDELMNHFHTQRLHYVGTDMATNFMRQQIEEMSDELYELYLQYHFSICERVDMTGATHHILDVHRKRQPKR